MTPTVERGRSFDAWADEYDRYRPTYPDALFMRIRSELGWSPQFEDIDAIVETAWRWRAGHPSGYRKAT